LISPERPRFGVYAADGALLAFGTQGGDPGMVDFAWFPRGTAPFANRYRE
jgi:hypothetical protein